MDALTKAMSKSPTDLMKDVIKSYTMVDYGIIQGTDGLTVDIDLVHKRHGYTVRLTQVELLTLGSAALSIKVAPSVGDIVLLLGSRQAIESLADITEVLEAGSHISYDLECLKAIQLAPAKDSKVVIEVSAEGVVNIQAEAINIMGDTKTFVTHSELNTALQTFMNALNLHTHPTAASGPPSPPMVTMTLDISAAKTTGLKTGA